MTRENSRRRCRKTPYMTAGDHAEELSRGASHGEQPHGGEARLIRTPEVGRDCFKAAERSPPEIAVAGERTDECGNTGGGGTAQCPPERRRRDSIAKHTALLVRSLRLPLRKWGRHLSGSSCRI